MRRRSSGSTEEDDLDEPLPADPLHLEDDGRKRSFTSSKFDLARHSETLDRRKVEKLLSTAPLTTNAWAPVSDTYEDSEPRERPSVTAGRPSMKDKMQTPIDHRRSRVRSPWKGSFLALTVTLLSVLFLVAIVRSLVTRQLDPKGCNMSYMSPMYAKLSDFDTEHTRFASKYSLYLYREERVDEDTMVSYMHALAERE